MKVRQEEEEMMNISKLVHALPKIGHFDDFDTYFLNLQDKKCACGPTKEEASKDYAAMLRSRQII